MSGDDGATIRESERDAPALGKTLGHLGLDESAIAMHVILVAAQPAELSLELVGKC